MFVMCFQEALYTICIRRPHGCRGTYLLLLPLTFSPTPGVASIVLHLSLQVPLYPVRYVLYLQRHSLTVTRAFETGFLPSSPSLLLVPGIGRGTYLVGL